MLLYRVTVFGEPKGPWRRSKRQAERDAAELGLGAYDDTKRFYLSAPADFAWIHENELSRQSIAAAHPASNMRTPCLEPLQVRRRA